MGRQRTGTAEPACVSDGPCLTSGASRVDVPLREPLNRNISSTSSDSLLSAAHPLFSPDGPATGTTASGGVADEVRRLLGDVLARAVPLDVEGAARCKLPEDMERLLDD